jgi:hypothetical protein
MTTHLQTKKDDSFLKSIADGVFQIEELARLHLFKILETN